MRPHEIGLHTRLLIPDAWTCFTYRGFLYVRGEDGRFVVRGKLEAKVA